jgi:hypothetical protein
VSETIEVQFDDIQGDLNNLRILLFKAAEKVTYDRTTYLVCKNIYSEKYVYLEVTVGTSNVANGYAVYVNPKLLKRPKTSKRSEVCHVTYNVCQSKALNGSYFEYAVNEWMKYITRP